VPFELVTLAEVGIDTEVEEVGRTFEENAIIKAATLADESGLLSLADDSGLEVDALDGEPGTLSARYAGENASDADRVRYLLSKLEGVPREKRQARFRCVIAIANPQGKVELCSGECDGVIALKPRGDKGFGYDPVFYLPELKKTMAELPPEEKNKLSHRGRAAAKARKVLERLAS
jgi:XTP/dITP diphosphohydrolase